ncbi:hypothetical protein ABB07_38505 [Streptomyces incarnatus]|uniref:Lantibiotic dehydratase N-terminal domain-containing protein n=1 Tax=Streptomyces incarnatus TaxID=665007 RepID=A0ABN4GPK9_9ACTN|nr:lantibiotic dehydratase [Streptomyces incarnatus]AKJ15733.1 hypothetical protein ABB07_38505 [Streptomyces incarnatus]
MGTSGASSSDNRLRDEDMHEGTSDVGGGWSFVPVALLRHAGFPVALLDRFADVSAAEEADLLLTRADAARHLAQEVKAALREARVGSQGDISSGVGMLRAFGDQDLARLRADLAPSALEIVERYQDAALGLDRMWIQFERDMTEGLARARHNVQELFRDPALKQVLLLSNDARFPEFADWIDRGSGGSPGRARRMTDLLAMYLQRVTTKNETHSHFGPLGVARVSPGTSGISWAAGPLRRTAFLTHWAGEQLAETFSRRPEAFEEVRPRRRPLAFAEGSRLALYAFESVTGMPDGWRFVPVATATLDDDQLWLWQRCDGECTVARLRRAWHLREDEGDAPLRGFDDVLNELIEKDWLVGRWEIPIGCPYPLRVLTEHLQSPDVPRTADGARDLATAAWFEAMLQEFATAPMANRAALLTSMKEHFHQVTGAAANRAGGRHYADRSILYEEAHGPVRDLRIGQGIADLISRELTIVYDLALLAPRLRVRRELEVLGRWVERRFGAEVDVPLEHFYNGFYADRPELARECEDIDREITAVDREITALLLDGYEEGTDEAVVDRERLEEFLARFPSSPPALCNPDVMIASENAGALARGDLLAVVGDCHGLRELLTHSSFAPLIQTEAPELLDEVYSRYQDMLDSDELLLDLARAHPDKTGAQLVYPCPDLEVYGLSAKTRDQVLQPQQLYVTVRGGRAQLRAQGTEMRLKLLAPLAGGPSIRQDPLSPFAFPRHFGGIGLGAADHDRLPRIRCGRVVLQRARRRIPAQAFRGWSPGVHRGNGDAAEFAAGRMLRRAFDLPEQGFVKIPGEPKPVYVDWESPLLVRQIFRLVRKTDLPVDFSEMLPSREQLWLEIGGQRFTSELRCAVFSRRVG